MIDIVTPISIIALVMCILGAVGCVYGLFCVVCDCLKWLFKDKQDTGAKP